MWIFHFISLFYIIIVENRCTYYEIFCDNIYQIAFILRKGNREWVNFAEIGINLKKTYIQQSLVFMNLGL